MCVPAAGGKHLSERAAELVQRAADGIRKTVLAGEYGISRQTVYQYLRQANLP